MNFKTDIFGTFLCKKIYHQDLDTANMPPEVAASTYSTEPPHRMYIEEVEEIFGTIKV